MACPDIEHKLNIEMAGLAKSLILWRASQNKTANTYAIEIPL
jgi:hypothetical protein